MLEHMITPFYRYADFTGRSRRREFWSFALLHLVITSVLVSLAISTGFSYRVLLQRAEFGGSLGVAAIAFFGILAMYALAVLVPTVAVNVRRLHDRDLSGWWCLGFVVLGAVPLLGWIGNVAYLVLMAMPGTEGANRYGNDPRDPEVPEIFV
ncbi:DUF805 domain-containing protein [Novosphingobium malaysiense]|uniref:Membrane protein n=1 Tax=Novosphingobium malaysiense TaxID=1348853 RepID=A0A0B1ZTZ8_9SPHN|nr:DUF805 domain-containing protein [Novosphingobium malaysiense]KHK92592.1 membrane protein [Novosphingobium malaysiense]